MIPMPKASAARPGLWCERARSRRTEGWFHESWQARRPIQHLNGESSYDGMVALVLPLRRLWASRQDASSERVSSQGRPAGIGASRCLSRRSSLASPIGLNCLWLLCIVSRRSMLRQKILDFFRKQSAGDQNYERRRVRQDAQNGHPARPQPMKAPEA